MCEGSFNEFSVCLVYLITASFIKLLFLCISKLVYTPQPFSWRNHSKVKKNIRWNRVCMFQADWIQEWYSPEKKLLQIKYKAFLFFCKSQKMLSHIHIVQFSDIICYHTFVNVVQSFWHLDLFTYSLMAHPNEPKEILK